MSGTVELDRDGAHLLIRFPYREDLVAMVKELPGRRWDPRNKVWRVPARHVEAVYQLCSRHLFDFASEVPALLAGTLQATPPSAPSPGASTPHTPATGPVPTTDAPQDRAGAALSVSQLNAAVRDGLRDRFPEAFWVAGEIVDFDKSQGRQHRFFQLVEKAEAQARPHAAVEVALFAGTAERLLPALAKGDPPLTLRDGLEIRVLVRVDLYVATGRFQIVVQDIDPTFTLGKLSLSREQIVRELLQRGLADRNRALGLPVPALRIGVLTSPDADGWNDFLRHLEESRCGFDVTMFPVRVQGPELRPTMLAGLRWFAERASEFDVVCVVRGGGSRTDLAWFDDRDVAIAVATHPLKVLVGIGHQRDQSVLDAVAQSHKTPTAVAEFLVRCAQSARQSLAEQALRLGDAVADLLHDARHRTADLARRIAAAAMLHCREQGRDLQLAGRRLTAAAAGHFATRRAALTRGTERLAASTERLFERHRARLAHADVQRRLLDPRRVLQRGYVLLRRRDGRIATSLAGVNPGDQVELQFRDGRADATIDATSPQHHDRQEEEGR